MSILVKNTSEEEALPAPPLRDDGGYYRFEMITDNGWSRVYDDTTEGLLAHLIPGYLDLDEEARLAARIRHAVDTQVILQAWINQDHADVPRTDQEQTLLTAPRHVQPDILIWSSAIPLVLVDAFYAPFSDLPAPSSEIADVADAPNLWILRPAASEMDYLRSLHETAVITLNIARDEVV